MCTVTVHIHIITEHYKSETFSIVLECSAENENEQSLFQVKTTITIYDIRQHLYR